MEFNEIMYCLVAGTTSENLDELIIGMENIINGKPSADIILSLITVMGFVLSDLDDSLSSAIIEHLPQIVERSIELCEDPDTRH